MWGLFVAIWMLAAPPDPPEFGDKVAFVQFTDVQCAESDQIVSQAELIQSLTNETVAQQRAAGKLMEDVNMDRIIDAVGLCTAVGALSIVATVSTLVALCCVACSGLFASEGGEAGLFCGMAGTMCFSCLTCIVCIAQLIVQIIFWAEVYAMDNCEGPGMDNLNLAASFLWVAFILNCSGCVLQMVDANDKRSSKGTMDVMQEAALEAAIERELEKAMAVAIQSQAMAPKAEPKIHVPSWRVAPKADLGDGPAPGWTMPAC
eukprot:SAG31_NODE_4145_length_3534_cov_3.048326_2_plen_261_part_00